MVESWLGVVGMVLGVAGILGGASAYFSSSRSKTVIDLQEKELKALDDSNKRLDNENKVLKDELSRSQERNKMLEETVTAAPEIAKLVATMGKQHSEVVTKISNLTDKVGEIAEVLAISLGNGAVLLKPGDKNVSRRKKRTTRQSSSQ